MSAVIPYIHMTFGGCFLLYFLFLWIYCRKIPAFGWMWLGMGIFFLIFGKKMAVMLCFCTAAFLLAAFFLARQGRKEPKPGADYVILLGAHVNGYVPSRALRSRIMAAYDYLRDNPSTKGVLSGGQGKGEKISEALCMEQELVKLGIGSERLILEDKSTTTKENIAFAGQMIEKEEKDTKQNRGKEGLHIIIVTNDFHAFRGKQIGKDAGYGQVETMGAPSAKPMKIHYYTREILSWIKYLAHI